MVVDGDVVGVAGSLVALDGTAVVDAVLVGGTVDVVVVVGGVCSRRSPAVWSPPAAMVTQSLSPPTCVGVSRLLVSPCPSAPNLPLPQVHRVPSVLIAAVWAELDEMVAQVVSVPTLVGTSVRIFDATRQPRVHLGELTRHRNRADPRPSRGRAGVEGPPRRTRMFRFVTIATEPQQFWAPMLKM